MAERARRPRLLEDLLVPEELVRNRDGATDVALQTGFVGWSAVLRGHKPRFKPFPRHGLFVECRQPVYLAFAATLWTGPVLTLDRLALALVWTAYCVVGPCLKERRYLARHGALYAAYQREVPYLIPSSASRLVRS